MLTSSNQSFLRTMTLQDELTAFLSFIFARADAGDLSRSELDSIFIKGGIVLGGNGILTEEDPAQVPVLRHGLHVMKKSLQEIRPDLYSRFKAETNGLER